MPRRIGLALAALMAGSGLALADKMLTGEDAAYIDWGVNNCGVKSTDKEHAMVDKANAKDAAGFLRTYQSKDLSDARSSPSKQEAMCSDIKTWYGPFGSRFAASSSETTRRPQQLPTSPRLRQPLPAKASAVPTSEGPTAPIWHPPAIGGLQGS
jgi:hypothetical protein